MLESPSSARWEIALEMPSNRSLESTTPGAELVGRRVLGFDSRTGEVRLAFLARPEFANRHGTVSGGFLAAMLDSVTAAPILASLAEDRSIVTTNLQVFYEKPAQLGELFGCGRISSRDEREVHSEGELTDPAGNVVARATATFRLVRPR